MSLSVREATEKLIEPILAKKNLYLVDIEYVKEGPDWYLRVFIDKDGGVSIDECGDVSGELGEKLDEEDLIKGSYFLEVSSPGVERPLKTKKDIQANIGHNIYVSLYVHIDGEKEYEGLLKDFQEDVLTIEYQILSRKKEVDIPYDKIAKARRAVAL